MELGEELKSLEQLLLFGKKEDAIRAIQRLDGQFEQMPYVESRTKTVASTERSAGLSVWQPRSRLSSGFTLRER